MSDQQPAEEDDERQEGDARERRALPPADGEAETRVTPPPPSGGQQETGSDLLTMATNLNRPAAEGGDEATMATNLNRPAEVAGDDQTLLTDAAAGQSPRSGARPASGTAVTMPMEGAASGTTSSAELMIEGQVLGDYEIGRKLGQGGMGAVFKGRQVSLDRPVAIKVLPSHLSQDKGFIDRFQLEARAVAKLTSPHIVQVYGAGESDGLHYFAMEYVDGKDLAERMKEGLRPTPEETVELILQAARGLAAAGDHGIIHRDIKPHNMMVTERGVLKIMDFGLVKVSDSGQGLTMTGAVMGTVSYFSPEQGRGLKCDHRTDLYALGVVLYELLTGTLPFTGPDATAVIYQHIHSAPRPPVEINPDVPEDLQAVVLKCMQKKPENRYQNAHELVADLERIAQGLKPLEALKDPELLRSGATMVKQASFQQERRGAPLVLLVAVLLVAAAAGGWWYYSNHLAAPGIDQGGDGPVRVEITEDPDQLEARLAIEAGDWERAEALIAVHRGEEAAQAWRRLDRRLLAGRTQALAAAARSAMAGGDTGRAAAAIEELAGLAPDDGRLPALREELATLGERSQRLEQVRGLLEAGRPEQALAICDGLLSEDAADQATVELRERARGMLALLQTADERLADGAYDTALGIFTKMLSDDPNQRARAGIKAVDLARGLHAAIDSGAFDLASDQLAKLGEMLPASKTLAAAERRLRRARVHAEGVTAIEAGRWAAARQAIASLREEDPASPQAQSLEQHLREQQALTELALVLEAGDLEGAREQLALIGELSADEAVIAKARTMLDESRLELQAEAEAAAARERAIAARFTTLEEGLASGDIEPDAAAATLVELAERYGEERQELPRLRALIADRRAALAAGALLADLDQALAAGDPAAMQALVADADLRTALEVLADEENLVFSHRLGGIERSADGILVDAILRNGFAIYPERDISCRYRLERVDEGWVISEARFAKQ